MAGDLVLGLDVGTTRCKAVLVDREGVEVVEADRPTPFARTGAGIEMTVPALLATVAGTVADLGSALGSVSGVGIAGMAECGAPLGRGGEALAPVISWHDPRGADVVADLTAVFGDELALRTGQRLRPVSTLAKLGWQVRHGVGPVRRWLGVPELCLRALTGAEATEHSLASRTGGYDVLAREWMASVCAAAGFDAGCLPPVQSAGSAMGVIRGGGRWGLPAGIPVTLAGHDHLAGALGSGAGRGDLVNSVGTAETVLGQLASAPDLGVAFAQRTPVSVAPGGEGWVVLGGAARAGVVLAAAAGLLGRSLAELDTLAMAARDPLPDVAALLADLQEGRAVALPEGPPGVVWRGLLRALCARTAETAARVAASAPGDRLLVIGGGARSEVWLAEKAAALPYALSVPPVRQAAARGAALCAGTAAGWWPFPGTGRQD